MIFISYKNEELEQARAVCSLLEANGFDCWMAPDSIAPGAEYGEQITAAIRACDAQVLLLTEAAQESTPVLSEVDLAITFKKDIVPLHLDEVPLNDAFLFRLGVVQRIEAMGRAEQACKELVLRLREVCAPDEPGEPGEELQASVVVPPEVPKALSLRRPRPRRPWSTILTGIPLHIGIFVLSIVGFVIAALFDTEAQHAPIYVIFCIILFEVVFLMIRLVGWLTRSVWRGASKMIKHDKES